MIRILSLVSYPFLPAHMGGQKAIAHFYRHLAPFVSLTCVTTKNNDPQSADGYEVLNILSNSPLRYANIFYVNKLKKIIRERQITHLLIEHPYYGWLGTWLQSATGVKLIVRSHNIEGLRWKSLGKWWWKLLWRYERRTHRKADYNFFIQQEDFDYARKHFELRREKCMVLTYGVERTSPPSAGERQAARQQLLQKHSIPATNTILLFNGAFHYLPNLNALQKILSDINPFLQQHKNFSYTILICGKNIPQHLSGGNYPNVVFAGFVEDVSVYFKGAGVFLNPVTEGGGIKTKIVEAIELGTTVVSLQSGATGMRSAACGSKLVLVKENDAQAFADAVVKQSGNETITPPSFYEYYGWTPIMKRAVAFLQAGQIT